MTQCPPVLLTIFNRPGQTQQVFGAIRQARPGKLYVAADGPRIDRKEDQDRCSATRHILDQVDWDCQVFRLFRQRNLGCKRAMAEGISWFFEHEPAGIVIEDDCVADVSFFQLCGELLPRYADDKRIGMISGINHYAVQTDPDASYHFSKLGRVWGWASWRDRWALYDDAADAYSDRIDHLRQTVGQTQGYRQGFFTILDRDREGRISTWDCYWDLALHAHGLLTVRPRVNLVSNVGFGEGATHTLKAAKSEILHRSSLDFPLRHPEQVVQDRIADLKHEQALYPNSRLRQIIRKTGIGGLLKTIGLR